jgi:MarR family 2-MHQ and catechol resistance regulon transcriptional repressor
MWMGEHTQVDQVDLWRNFAKTLRAVQKLLDSRLKAAGLGYQEVKVIAELVENGRMPMAKLAEKIMFTQAGVTYLVDKLEEQGYVARVRSSEDRRIIYVEATEKGRQALDQGLVVMRQATIRVFENLSQDELVALNNILLKIQRNVDALLEANW